MRSILKWLVGLTTTIIIGATAYYVRANDERLGALETYRITHGIEHARDNGELRERSVRIEETVKRLDEIIRYQFGIPRER